MQFLRGRSGTHDGLTLEPVLLTVSLHLRPSELKLEKQPKSAFISIGGKMDEQDKDCLGGTLTYKRESRTTQLLFEFWLIY